MNSKIKEQMEKGFIYTEKQMRELIWKNYGYGFFCGATAMAIISLIVVTINLIQCLK